jgi:hypothetical protein
MCCVVKLDGVAVADSDFSEEISMLPVLFYRERSVRRRRKP